jgi:hypothetical protein
VRRLASSIFGTVCNWKESAVKEFTTLLAGYPRERLQARTMSCPPAS